MEQTRTILLQASVWRVFPLFTPRGESHWATVWALSTYDPAAHHLCYTRITPGALAGLVDVRCAEQEPGTTAATVTYSFTALGVPGRAYLDTFPAAHYAAMVAEWERAINHYLHTGAALAHH